MDPLSVLGIAAAAVQFLEFGAKGCKKLLALYATSNLEVDAALGQMAFEGTSRDLYQFSRRFHGRQSLPPPSSGGGRDEQVTQCLLAIDQLMNSCACIAGELSDRFDKLGRANDRKHFLTSPIDTMKKMWSATEIRSLTEQMASYQTQLSLRLLEYLTLKIDGMDQSIEQNYSKVIQVLSISESKIDHLCQQSTALQDRMDESHLVTETHHEKTVAALLTLENGETRLLSPTSSEDAIVPNASQRIMKVQSGRATSCPMEPIQQRILASLKFREQSHRYYGVKDAHSKTYEWIFRPRETQDNDGDDGGIVVAPPCAPFLEWLAEGQGCYWISGKAGSGKSTLAKFIHEHPRTKKSLENWAAAAGRDLCMASFFFWNLGSRMQKSQAGLLRSLLHAILSQRAYLISLIMPELCSMIMTDGGMRLGVPSISELLHWFRQLPKITKSQLRICILIDGIDEYDGDYHDMIDLVKSLSSDDHIKFIVSSRPIPSCVEAFRSCPNLRLQDLTRDDILQYANDHLRERLERRHRQVSDRIIKFIQEKSRGVFLWVVLVVRSVVSGVENCDSSSELLERLNELPSDLKDLYSHMLKRMPHSYRVQASELFQLCMQSLTVQKGRFPLTPTQLHFADFTDEATLKHPMDYLSPGEEESIASSVEGRLRSRCCGLLEVQRMRYTISGTFSRSVVEQCTVEFIHRTAVEFLRIAEFWDDLVSLTATTHFDASTSLFKSCVLLAKTQGVVNIISLRDDEVWRQASCALEYAVVVENSGSHVSSPLLQELDRVVSNYWKHASNFSLDSRLSKTRGSHWALGFTVSSAGGDMDLLAAHSATSTLQEFMPKATKPIDFMTIAMVLCLDSFLAGKLSGTAVDDDAPRVHRRQGSSSPSRPTRLLFDALACISTWADNAKETVMYLDRDEILARYVSTCNMLLAHGADPNKANPGGRTPWHVLLEFGPPLGGRDLSVLRRQYTERRFPFLFCQLLTSFLQAGADPTRTIVWKEEFRKGEEGTFKTYYTVTQLVDALVVGEADSLAPYGLSPSASHSGLDEFRASLAALVRQCINNDAAKQNRRLELERKHDEKLTPTGLWVKRRAQQGKRLKNWLSTVLKEPDYLSGQRPDKPNENSDMDDGF